MRKQGLLLVIIIIGLLWKVPYNENPSNILPNQFSFDHSSTSITFSSHETIPQADSYTVKISADKPYRDNFGNYYVSGYYVVVDDNGEDFTGFLSKLDAQGNLLWTKYLLGDGYDLGGQSVVFDSIGNIYISSRTQDKTYNVVNTFDNTSLYDAFRDSGDVYIQKYNPNGDLLWSTYFGGLATEFWINHEIDENDNLYVYGATNFPGTPLVDSWLNAEFTPGSDTFLVKYSSDGEFQWSTIYGNPNGPHQAPDGVMRDNGLLTLMGYNAGGDDNASTAYHGSYDLFVLELNVTSQEFVWEGLYGGSFLDWGRELVYDDSNNLYIAGFTASDDITHVNAYDNTLNGSSDAYILKLDSSHNIVWSTYFGGTNQEQVHGLYLDAEDNLVMMGLTASDDFEVTDSSFHLGSQDIFLTRMSNDGTQVLQSTYLGSTGSEARDWATLIEGAFTVDTLNYTFYSQGDLLDASSFTYPFDFGETEHGILVEFDQSTFGVNKIINNLVVPEPDKDYDNDGLTNWQEYELFRDENYQIDPMDWDSDDDGLPDGWEITYGLQPDVPLEPSGDGDSLDSDGLSNLQEYLFGTQPNNTDTDGDGMPDKYEYDNGLIGTEDDSLEDLDGDYMPNLYEFTHLLNASRNDGNEDPDKDRALNTFEFQSGTDPQNADTDGDGINDGYELEHGMDPLRNDLNWDADGDGLPNEFEYRYKLNPGKPYEGWAIMTVIVLMVSTTIYLLVRSKRRNKKAKEEGYEDFAQKKMVLNAEYGSLDEFNESKERGFLHKNADVAFKSVSFGSVGQYLSGLDQISNDVTSKISQNILDKYLEQIRSIKTPIQLIDIKSDVDNRSQQVNQYIDRISKILDVQEQIFQLETDNPLKDVTKSSLTQHMDQLNQLKLRLDDFLLQTSAGIRERENWLKPWEGMWKLIQITEDNTPIPISDIMQVVSIDEEHAIELITTLLQENPEFGSYDKELKTYRKSKQSIIAAYMQKALESIKNN